MTETSSSPAPRRGLTGAVAVGVGIFASRIAGLVRERALAHYLGNTPAAGAFRAALRIPNLLQNLLGEGVLSASFIPVYTRLITAGRHQDAARVARAVATLLALIASLVAVVGMLLAEPMVEILAPGYSGGTRELTIDLVRILFPGVTLLVMSAWCLGVLNSHRKFLLSYASPVLWNVALIATAVVAGRRFAGSADGGYSLAIWLGWGAVIGSALQLLVQLPSVLYLVGSARPTLGIGDEGVRTTIRAFGPVLLGRGSVQLSSYLDQLLASYLGAATVSAIAYAQTLFLLPVGLFGMAISAAELPEMSAGGSGETLNQHLQQRLTGSLRRVVFLVVPSAVAFVAIGGPIVALLFQSGRFHAGDTVDVWIILAGSAIGLSAGTQGRLLSSAFYALGDTKSQLYAGLVRVSITFVAGWALVLPIRDAFGYGPTWAAFGLTASAGVAAWVEFALLRRWLGQRIGAVPIPVKLVATCFLVGGIAGAASGAIGWFMMFRMTVPAWAPALVTVPVFGALYLGIAHMLGVPEASGFVRRLLRRR